MSSSRISGVSDFQTLRRVKCIKPLSCEFSLCSLTVANILWREDGEHGVLILMWSVCLGCVNAAVHPVFGGSEPCALSFMSHYRSGDWKHVLCVL